MNKYAIGADIGGGHISAAIVNITTGTLVQGSRFTSKINNQDKSDTILDGWTQTIKKVIDYGQNIEIKGLGFAMPGPFDYVNGIGLFEKVAKFESLYGINVANEIRSRLKLSSHFPVFFMNDATAFGVGEAWKGAASNFNRVVALTLGTGFGSAFIEKGIPVVEGKTVPNMGCLWHIPVKEGIADDYFSTRWFEKSLYELTGIEVNGVKPIVELAEKDIHAKFLFWEYGNSMGELIGYWLNQFETECLVLGGNVSRAYHLFGNALEKRLEEQRVTVKIEQSTLNEDAALIGSARIIDPVYQRKITPVLSKM